MKFVNPELEVKRFDVADILTTSGATEAITQLGAMMEGECRGTAWDNNLKEDCI